ncbi:putative regulatory protein, FmdB family [Candidatus Electrothrix marina]|uniref:Putative regulatory protein, FmdB family n=1 Tax=Candidatus Electrothrix marina TaxID=1859130 RepID=A0A3S3RC43_9BACT|nr:putative regulatory protein, FmdB family [Candidatus Electrothrix marina]RWX50672.1 putative regulatory protein, FmdB family [Candidatus Electrothrix marina]RWX52226.1 putative regulatory protein, FmdB family [Candidatus Electrothrix marina]
MPVYEYECPACEKVFEVHQGMNDSPLTSCSVCGGEVKKIISMSAFHLKGGGWYSDGYASASASTSGSSVQGGAGTKAAEKSTATSTDSAKKPSAGGTDSACKGCPASS